MSRAPALVPLASSMSDQARTHLTRFVLVQARAMAELSRISWTGDPEAPDDFRSLTQAYVRSQVTGEPLPVSNLYCEPSIYEGVEANVAFRFWHDMTHLRLGQAFDLDGEIAVAKAHLAVLRACGYSEGTVEYELLHRDTLGQTLCNATIGTFPADQLCFARIGIETTLGEAIRREIRAERSS